MTPVNERERWEVLELIGAYAAGELEGEEARRAEQLIFDRPDYRRAAESYARMLVMLSTLSSEPVEAPEAVVSYAVRRAGADCGWTREGLRSGTDVLSRPASCTALEDSMG
jgi:anti-sigma-K factor RskA